MKIEQNSTSFFITGLNYGQEVTIAIDGEIVQKFNIQLDKARIGVYINKERANSPSFQKAS